MDSNTFRTQLRKELKSLNQEQLMHFAWICSVRAVPFLGISGNFNYWKKKDRQKYIFTIFYALDVIATYTTETINTFYKNVLNASAIVTEVAKVSADILDTIAAIYKDKETNYRVILSAAFAIASASNAATSVASAAIFKTVVDSDTSDNATDAYAVTTTSDTFIVNIYDNVIETFNFATESYNAYVYNEKKDFASIILQDLRNIQNNGKWEHPLYADFYGVIWDNFQKALEDEGCAYWSRLYKSIFENGFALDSKALFQRLNVPKEIQIQGASAVGLFLEEIENEGAERLNEARIIILGDKGAGKTCLARRLIDPNASMTNDNESTDGVDITLWKLEEDNINVRIWDFAGHTVTHAVHQFFLSERCLYIIVYDGRTEERNRLEYWLNHMKNYGGNDSKAIILINKRDQHSAIIPIISLKEQYPIENLYTFSIQDDKIALETFRNDVARYIKNNPSWDKLKIPKKYYQVKKDLEDLFTNGEKGKGKEQIKKEEFIKIANKYDIDKKEDLLKNLHALGVSLWYENMEEFDTLVLNPEWISHGVYKIINWVNEEKKYSLMLNDFATVFKNDASRYPKDKHEFIFKLMIRYELAYETDREKCLIIPHLLKEDRPLILPYFPLEGSLMLRYKAEQPLPPNTISRFIVRHNQQIRKEGESYVVWRYGVVLEDGNGNLALVREEDRTITVSVKGKNKTNYISILRETLNDIFKSYKSERPELQYRIERFGQLSEEIEVKKPLWLPDSKIFNQAIDNIPYYDDSTRQNINLNYVVNNYNIAGDNLIGGQGDQLIDRSFNTTFNFYDCNIGLQGDLNDLARSLTKIGNEENAKELTDAADALEEAKSCLKEEDVKKTGITKRLKRLIEDLGDEDSKLHKSVEGLKNGVGIAQDIAQGYNDIAQWLGLPQVPKPFLKKTAKD